MIDAGDLAVDDNGFVFVRTHEGWHLPPIGTASAGRYVGVSITVPQVFHHLIPVGDRPESGRYRSMFQHARVVALFHRPLPADAGYCEVDHINMNPRDDRPCNLRWKPAQYHRADAHHGRERSVAPPIQYNDPALRADALRARVAEEASRATALITVDEAGLPVNLPSATVECLLAAMAADPDVSRSVWADQSYWPILRGVLAASGNNAKLTEGRVTIECESAAFEGVARVFLMELSTSSRVYHACLRCGRQSFRCSDRSAQSHSVSERAVRELQCARPSSPRLGGQDRTRP